MAFSTLGAPRRLLLLAEDAPPLLLGPGCAMDPGTPDAPRVPRKGGPVALMVEGPGLRLETEAVPRLAPWHRSRLIRGHLSAAFPGSALVRGRLTLASDAVKDDGAQLTMVGFSGAGAGDVGAEAWRAALAARGIQALGPFCPALAAPGLARWLMALGTEGGEIETPPWTLMAIRGRAGTRLVAARGTMPALTRLAPEDLAGPALADEVRGTLAYLRRRGYAPGMTCALVVIDPTGHVGETDRALLAEALGGGPVFLPRSQDIDRLLGPPAPGLPGDGLLAWAALSDGLSRAMPLGAPGAPPRAAGGLGLPVRTLVLGGLALGGLALGLVETRGLEVLEAQRPVLETDLAEARAALTRERLALAALPATPDALRALAQDHPPALVDPRRDLEWIVANLGEGGLLERVDLDRGEVGARWTLTLTPEAAVGNGAYAARARLVDAFPGYRVRLQGGPDAARDPAAPPPPTVLILEPEERSDAAPETGS
jgi:hypothetical protein